MDNYFNKVSRKDVEFFEKLLGSRNISTSEEELVANSVDAYPGGFYKPEIVVWPESSEQVGEVLRYAYERKIPVYPKGGGTGLTGTVPIYGGILLSLVKMNKIIEVYEEDMQVRVQPGIIYDRLNKELERYGLFFPPDPSSGSWCTIGGMVASNSSGLKAVKYGTTREYVLGLEVGLPDGRIIRIGSRTFKYSTGFDLLKMMIGSQGTLGVFTEITLRLKNLPEYFQTAIAFFPSVESAVRAVYHIVRRGLDMAAIEFMDEKMMRAVAEYRKIDFPESQAMLLVEAHGSKMAVLETMEKCIHLLEENKSIEVRVAKDVEEREKFWAARKGAYPATLRLGRYMIISDIVVPLSKLYDAVQNSYELGRKYGVHASVIGHFGDGNLHVHWSAGNDRDKVEDLHRANDELARWAIDVGGAVSGEHGIGTEKKKFVKQQFREAFDLMLKIKKLVDPKCILSPGIIFDLEEVVQ
ncbi:MAG: FAD-binding protein [Thaumarchaeota archaeon]|nr:FAD-binding protein [Candidatus Geocrenenecus arthurdayi]MCL7402837.1 FAD-binding protein [Candidatus Geocrenenecus arthurdayi]